MNQNINISAIRGSFIDFVADPFYYPELETVRYIHDGLMIISGGIIQELGNYEKLKPKYPEIPITSYPGMLILPGFIDIHIHYPQTEIIASSSKQLKDYLDVYEKFGLVSNKSIFAHGIYLSDSEFNRLSQAGSTIAFCPTSNLFLGSGLFQLNTAKSQQTPVKVGLGTDVGGGTSFSIFQTMNDAYKISQLQGQNLSSLKAFYLATLGGANSLSLEHKIGNFDVGKEADLVVLDIRVTPLLKLRNSRNNSDSLTDIIDELFTLIILGDERVVQATYVAGNLVYEHKI